MQEPHEFSKMVDITYFVTSIVYIVMAVCGYAMFGLETLQEVSEQLFTFFRIMYLLVFINFII